DNKREDKKPAEQNIYSHYFTFGFGSLGVLAQSGIQEDLARRTNAPNFEAMRDEGRGTRDEAGAINDDVSGGIGRWQSRSRKPGRSSRTLPVRITFYSSLLSGQPRIPGGAAPLGAMISGDGRGIDRFQTTRQLPRLWWLPLIGLLKTFYSSVVTKLLPTSSRLRLVKNPFIFIPSIVAPFRIVKIAEIVLVPGFDGKIQLNLVDAWAYFSGRAPAALNFIKTKLSALAFKMSVWFERFDEWAKTLPKRKKRTVVKASLEEAMDAGTRGQGTGDRVQGSEEVTRDTSNEIRDTNTPVGALIQTSSSPVFDPNDKVWADWAKKNQQPSGDRVQGSGDRVIVLAKDVKAVAALTAQMFHNARKFSLTAGVTEAFPVNHAAIPQAPAALPQTSGENSPGSNGNISVFNIGVPTIPVTGILHINKTRQRGYRGAYLLAENRRGHKLSFRDPPAAG
ncbi:MAG: hypothetical protein AAB065_00065, partial [Deltaproteobacteria bacterium]